MSRPSTDSKNQLYVEFFGTATWLIMDTFWMLGSIEAATTAGFLTLGAWVYVYRFLPRRLPDLCANGAVVCWVLMNLLWMLGDEFDAPQLRPAALAAVSLSFLLLAIAIWRDGLQGSVLRMFRRFRFRRTT